MSEMSDWIAANQILVLTVVKSALVLSVLMTTIAYLVWFERKVIAHMQSRWGPYRVGPHGLLQPLADGLKFLFKEDLIIGTVTSKFVYLLAPFLSVSLALLAIAVIPFGPDVTILGTTVGLNIADIDVGLLFILAVTSLGVYAVSLAGWASNSKYPLLGGLRSAAQMVSYELALSFAVIGVLLLANTLSLQEIIAQQAGHWGSAIPRWFVFPQFIAFLIFFLGGLAETNRAPFDLPEAETELVAGFHTEYSSMKFAMFFMGEYAHMITTALVISVLFFGGWLSPFPGAPEWRWTQYFPPLATAALALLFLVNALRLPSKFNQALSFFAGAGLAGVSWILAQPAVLVAVQGPFWLISKAVVFLFIFIWIRATLPRFRYDQLMSFGWKLLVPLAILNIIVTSFIIAWMGK